MLSSRDYVSFQGFFITVCPEGILHVAEHAAKNNKLFAQNLSAPFVSLVFKDRLDKIIPYVDLLFCNEQEIEAYAQAHEWNTTDIKEIALKLSQEEKVRLSIHVSYSLLR